MLVRGAGGSMNCSIPFGREFGPRDPNVDWLFPFESPVLGMHPKGRIRQVGKHVGAKNLVPALFIAVGR